MSWKGYSSYGKSALGTSVSISGLDEFLAKVDAAGNDLIPACENAVNAALPIIETTMKAGAAKHMEGVGKYSNSEVYNAIESVPAQVQGNYIYGSVGVNTEKHPKAMAAVFEEYGDGHSAQFPDPFIRPALDNNKTKVKAAMRKELRAAGIPAEDSNIAVKPGKVGD